MGTESTGSDPERGKCHTPGPDPSYPKAILLACALGAADLALSACWTVPLDIGAEHAGVLTGFMNTFGNLGGFLGPIVVGQALKRWASWTFPLYITAAIYVFSAMAWLLVDPNKKITQT